jgi:hypothetical protein
MIHKELCRPIGIFEVVKRFVYGLYLSCNIQLVSYVGCNIVGVLVTVQGVASPLK